MGRLNRLYPRFLLIVLFSMTAAFASLAEESTLSPHPQITLADPSLDKETVAVLYRPVKADTSDLTAGSRNIRVLVHYSRTEFFVANGKPFGLEYEAFAEYENISTKTGENIPPKITVTFIPVRFDDLIPWLLEGKGDIAAGLLTATEERRQKVVFATPYIRDVTEVLVRHEAASPPTCLEGLSGRTVHVLRASSFVHHLHAVNIQLSASNRAPIKIVEMPASANDDDILEMLNAGIFEYTFVDGFMADLWSNVLPHIKVVNSVLLNKGGDIGWAVRRENPELLKSLNAFADYGMHHLKNKGKEAWNRYFVDTKLIKNPLSQEVFGRVKTLGPHFKDAGEKHKLDWLMMMAQGYQESQLDQSLKSPRGAIGIMQLLPGTARSVGYADISTARNNIAAGVAYLNFIRQNYFNEPGIPPDARIDFALAAYNAGPARIQSLRQEAKRRGLNPHIWFNNVERVALDRMGEETVRGMWRVLTNITSLTDCPTFWMKARPGFWPARLTFRTHRSNRNYFPYLP